LNRSLIATSSKKVRPKVEQYVEDKICGRYGHGKQRSGSAINFIPAIGISNQSIDRIDAVMPRLGGFLTF
jgi:hypothetical protein